MRMSSKSFLIVFSILIFSISLTFLEAHAPKYEPPPPPPPFSTPPPPPPPPPPVKPPYLKTPKVNINKPGGNPSSPGATTGGPASPGSTTPSPGALTGGPKSGAAGGLTRKRSNVTSVDVSWANWWARNRYQFMDIPKRLDTSAYPTTPKEDQESLKKHLNSQTCVLLRPYLKSPVARLKRASIVGLARLNDTQSLPGITEALTCNNQTVRDNALMALGLIDNPVARHPLLHIAGGEKTAAVRFLKQSSVPDYFQAFSLISLTLGKTKGIAPILKSLVTSKDCSPQVKAMALECLGMLGGPDEVRFLMELVNNNKKLSNELIASAITGIARSNDPICLPFLEKCLSSKSKPMVQSAALGIGRLARPDDMRLVKRLYGLYRSSSDKAIKGFSLVSMGMIGGPKAIAHLDYVITNAQSFDCGWACLAMGLAMQKTNQKSIVNRLISKAKGHANRSVRGAAIISLGLIGEKRTVPALIEILKKGDDPIVRCYAATALGLIKDEGALSPLRYALKKEKSPNVIAQAAIALAIMNDSASIEPMVEKLLTSNNDMVQTFLAMGLSFMGDMKAFDLVTDALRDNKLEEITKLHCIHLISQLVSGRKIPYLNPLAVGSNFACEYPLVDQLLMSGV